MLRYACWILLAVAGIFFVGCDEPVTPAQPAPAEPSPTEAEPAAVEEPAPATAEPTNPVVIIETSMGTIVAELWPNKAPITVANYLSYVDDGFFDGTIFHRVMPDFMIQGGGFLPDMSKKPTGDPIINEARADVGNVRGTLAMARTGHPHSATAQFFINRVDNGPKGLDHRGETMEGYGYCVFGKVIEGLDIVDAIAETPTKSVRLPGYRDPLQNVPVTTVTIISITRK